MPLLLFMFHSSRWLLATALVASLLSGLGNALLVALINRALNTEGAELDWLALQFAGVAVLVLGAGWSSQVLFVRLSQSTLARMRVHVSTLLTEAPYRHLEAQGPGRLMAILSDDIRSVSEFFVTLPNFTMHGAVVVGCLGYLGLLSWRVFVAALLITLLGGVGYYRAHVRALGQLRAARGHQDDLFKLFRAIHDGAKELKLHRRKRRVFVQELLKDSTEKVREHHTRGMSIYAASESFGVFLFFAFIGCVLFLMRRVVPMEPEVLSGYALVFLHMLLPLDALLMALPNVNRARVALERVQQGIGAVQTKLDASPSPGSTLPPPRFESLCFRGVTHRYQSDPEDQPFTVGPVDLDVRRGEMIFLVGGNGSGKTTLAKLLVGLYAPDRGEILWNGTPIQDFEAYRQNFSAIFSDYFLFDRLLGDTGDKSRAFVTRWLQDLELTKKVRIEDGRFSTTELSQGQRKRLALLVAAMEDRPVYLFDEWAADQDPVYKEIFYRKILPELKNRKKAVIAITHDDRYFHLADRCIVLESGKVVADGPASAAAFDVTAGATSPVCRALHSTP